MLQPRAHPPQTESLRSIFQTRASNLKSSEISAPTGQISTVFPAMALSMGMPGKTSTTERSPRSTTHSSPVPLISSQNRTHRVQTMQRLPHMEMVGPSSLVWRMFLSSTKRLLSGP